MDTYQQLLEEVLTNLIKKHFFGRKLEWGYHHDHGILDIDPELYVKLCQVVPDAVLHNAKEC